MPPRPYRATTYRERDLNYGSQTYFFDHTRTWRASPDEWSALSRGHLRDSTNMKDNTYQAHTVIPTRLIWNDEYDGQMIFGDLGGLKFPDICLAGEEKPRKEPHPGNLSRPGIEPGPAAWQARMLPLAPQRWTRIGIVIKNHLILSQDQIYSPVLVSKISDVHGRLARRRACDVGEAKEGLENELWRRWSNGWVGEWTVT